ncbi:MAG: ABC transporter permease [Bacteroidota bacterium]
MFKNYLVLALKVLKRKPFYTFISLFGISFTLMILMLLTSLINATLGENPPMSHADRMIIMPTMERTRTETDTILHVDTALVAGVERYDSTYTYEDNVVSNSNGPTSYRFVTENLANLEEAEHTAFIHNNSHIDGYLDGRKFSFEPYYVNAGYWDVFDYEFLHGDRFGQEDVDQANKIVVITTKAAEEYFGEVSASILDREMEMGGQRYRVRGIVDRPYSDNPLIGGDIYLPMTTLDNRALASEELYGGFMTAFLVPSSDRLEALQSEINFLAENYQLPPDSYFDAIKLYNSTPRDGYAQALLGERDPKVARRRLYIPVTVLLLLFVALPLLNLINLNVGRVAERQGEIGVRKAFGATGRDILVQFIFENLVLTFIGGIIGLLLALGLISYVNENDLLGITRLAYNANVFMYFLIVVVFFGFVSGILPAYRMSRANVANSLR